MTSLTGYPSLPIAEQVRRRRIQLQYRYRKVGMATGIRKSEPREDPSMLGRLYGLSRPIYPFAARRASFHES
jgi:hypothetical protein